MGQWLTAAIQTVSEDNTQKTLRLVIWYNSSLGVTDSVNSFVVSGNWSYSGATSISVPSSGGSQIIYASDIVVTKQYGATVTVSFGASLTGIEYWGSGQVIYASGSHTVAARPYEVPAAPTGAAVSRVSDSTHTVTWTRHPSTAAPYTSQRIQRVSSGNPWTTIAEISGSATSFTDNTTTSNYGYRWRVVAVNSSGSATSAQTDPTTYTTPSAPTGAAAVKSGLDIVVTWTGTCRYYDHVTEIEESQDGGAWTYKTTVSSGVSTWTHTSPSSSVTHAYRVRHRNTIGTILYSAYSTTGTVQLQAPPNAPTGLGPSTVRDATEDVTLYWTHNPVDTSPQTAFELRHRLVGGSWTTVAVTSASSTWVLPGGTYANGLTVEWEVRTKGSDPDYSPWSATASSPTSTRPIVTISYPSEPVAVELSELTVTWAFYDAESTAQVAWAARLYGSGGAQVEVLSGVGATTSATFSTPLPDGSSWSVRVSAADGAGLWSAQDIVAFNVSYALPEAPDVALTWDPETATVTIDIVNGEPAAAGNAYGEGLYGDGGYGGTGYGGAPGVATAYVRVWRQIDDGEWEMIATGVPPNSTIVDWAPTTLGINHYRVDAISDLPSMATTYVDQATSGTTAIFVSGGPAFSQVCQVRHDPTVSINGGRTRVLRRFAGRTDPVVFSGTTTTRELSASALIVGGTADSTPDEWLDLHDLASPHLWRDPDGRRVVVALDEPKIKREDGGRAWSLGISATRIDS